MTTRADLIETAARALAELESEGTEVIWTAESFMEEATAVLDAVLPQITTVEQLEALHPATWLLGRTLPGRPELWERGSMEPERLDRYLEAFGPFVVVWQPQPEQETRADA